MKGVSAPSPSQEIRLRQYLEKVEKQFRWDRDPNRKPVIFFAKDRDTPPRPDTSKDEERASALGRLSEFQAAAVEKRRELLSEEVDAVRTISPRAAAAYEADLRYWRGMDEHHLDVEKGNQDARIMRRWEVQESERKEERADRAKERLLDSDYPPIFEDGR